MPKKAALPKIGRLETRLATQDLGFVMQSVNLRKVSASNFTAADWVREACLEKLDRESREETAEVEGIFAKTLWRAINRVCSMLAKIAIDVHAIYLFLAKVDRAQMDDSTNIARKYLGQKLTPDETKIADNMSNQVNNRS